VPRGIRNAAFACLILSAAVGLGACQQTWFLFRPLEVSDARVTKSPWPAFEDPALQKKLDDATEDAFRVEESTLKEMREVRALTLSALSLACVFAFVGAGRMLRPLGLPREGVRRLLAGAALVAAILRTVDGAQLAAVSKRQGPLFARAFASLPKLSELQRWPGVMLIGFAIGQTLLTAGAFLLVSQYFRSDRVRKIVEFRDQHPE
jgi:hypothetical protein